jgi:hypothetical protein
MPLARLKFPPLFRVPKSFTDPLLKTAAWVKSLPKFESPTTRPDWLLDRKALGDGWHLLTFYCYLEKVETGAFCPGRDP